MLVERIDMDNIVEIDGKKIGNGKPGSITLRLIEKFKKIRMKGTQVYR